MRNFTAAAAFTFLLVSASYLSIPAQQTAKSEIKKYDIDNCVNTFNPEKTERTGAGYQYWFANKDFIDGRTLKLSVVAPGKATHAPHKHFEDEFFFVVEGTAEFYLDGRTKTAGPMTSFYCPSGMEHGIRNIGTTELKYLVIKKYDNFPPISLKDFEDSANHWYGIIDDRQIIAALPERPKYKPEEIRKIADNILLYQRANGGWPKNYDMQAILTDAQRDSLISSVNDIEVTGFDNGATHSQIEYLAQAYTLTKDERYCTAAVKGFQYILKAQYPNGGWPQFFPDTSGYRKYITFNDAAMPGIMQCLLNVVQNKPYYSFIDEGLRNEIKSSFDKGIECILNCQIRQNGELTAWCQQHDNIDLHPQNARTFEPAAICSKESCDILRVLMQIKNPDMRVSESISSAVRWLKKSAIHGIRVKTVEAPSEQFIYRKSGTDKMAVEDKTAPRIWTRFYDLKTNRPIFCRRSGQIVYTLAEVERERRDGYSWYNYDPEGIIKKFDKRTKK